MGDQPTRRNSYGLWMALVALAVLVTTGVAACFYFYRKPHLEPPSAHAPAPAENLAEQVHTFCGACHAYPPPDSFPKSAWQHEVEQGYVFYGHSNLPLQPPPLEQVVQYYRDLAPVELPVPVINRATGPPPVRFARTGYPMPQPALQPVISNVNLVHLSDESRLDLLACDMRAGLVMALKPYAPAPTWQVLGKAHNPAHAEVVDLDGDGIKDILVADLGNFQPTDRRSGRVLWLRGQRDGSFTPITLLDEVGRVADVQAADFRGVGKLDLIVAVFGWRSTGEIIYLENQTTDWSQPKFVPHILDDRHGAIHVPVGDINGDGKLDFVALISQEHETVVAFLGDGKGNFRKETIYKAPHPAYGSSGIQLVDLNRDGKLDVLYTNGDTLDLPYLLKPYHSIQWLENRGGFPFVHHPITSMYGVHRAVAADFSGTGRMDIVAVSFLPSDGFPQRKEQSLDAVIYLEQTTPGQFVRHSLESGTCDHVTCAAGDILGRRKIDFVTGNYVTPKEGEAVTIWNNQGTRKP